MAAQPLAVQVGVAPACQALGVSRATFYRRQRPTPGHQQPRPTPARALCESEREHVLDVLACPRFVDRAPAEVVATLLDEGQYLCSARTMYRILAANQPVRERRNQRDHPQYTKPELMATGPNQTWSWDITKLLGPKKWTYFYLYVVLDIFSRYAVGWMVADRENSALAGRLIEQTCHKQGVQPQVLTLHSDRGAPMTSKCTAQLLADLGGRVAPGDCSPEALTRTGQGDFHHPAPPLMCLVATPPYPHDNPRPGKREAFQQSAEPLPRETRTLAASRSTTLSSDVDMNSSINASAMFPQLRLTPARAAFARPGPRATAFPDVTAPMQPSDSLAPFGRRSGHPSPAAYLGAEVLFFTAAPVPPLTGATPETFLPRLPASRLSPEEKRGDPRCLGHPLRACRGLRPRRVRPPLARSR